VRGWLNLWEIYGMEGGLCPLLDAFFVPIMPLRRLMLNFDNPASRDFCGVLRQHLSALSALEWNSFHSVCPAAMLQALLEQAPCLAELAEMAAWAAPSLLSC